jgi:hypothetical protein
VPWWKIKPKQSAPPRQELMHPPGEVARFVTDQALYSSKVRSGRSTSLGGELDLPQVRRRGAQQAMTGQEMAGRNGRGAPTAPQQQGKSRHRPW